MYDEKRDRIVRDHDFDGLWGGKTIKDLLDDMCDERDKIQNIYYGESAPRKAMEKLMPDILNLMAEAFKLNPDTQEEEFEILIEKTKNTLEETKEYIGLIDMKMITYDKYLGLSCGRLFKQLKEYLGAYDELMYKYLRMFPITEKQQENIREGVKRRVYELLGIPLDEKERTVQDKKKIERYSSIFFQRCYNELMKQGILARPYEKTIQRDYLNAIHRIQYWEPECGVVNLKMEAHKNLKERRALNQLTDSATEYTFITETKEIIP